MNNQVQTVAENAVNEFGTVTYKHGGCGCKGLPFYLYISIIRDALLKFYESGCTELSGVHFLPGRAEPEKKIKFKTIVYKDAVASRFVLSSAEYSKTTGQTDSLWAKNVGGVVSTPDSAIFPEPPVSRNFEPYTPDDPRTAAFCDRYADVVRFSVCRSGSEWALDFHFTKPSDSRAPSMHPDAFDYMLNLAVRVILSDDYSPLSLGSFLISGEVGEESRLYVRQNKGTDGLDDAVSLDFIVADGASRTIACINNFVFAPAASKKRMVPPAAGVRKENPVRGRVGRRQDYVSEVNGLTWRQMNCYERSFGLLLGRENPKLIVWYKFLLGAFLGYDLTAFNPQIDWDRMASEVLSLLGYELSDIPVDDPRSLHAVIAAYIDRGQAVCALYDEYYVFYTRYYLKSHSDHVCVIDQYDPDRELYSIVDHSHLSIGVKSSSVNYGHFFCPYQTLDRIYTDRPEKRFIKILHRAADSADSAEEKARTLCKAILRFLTDHPQPGCDINIIRESFAKDGEKFDADIVDLLYYQLGKKELLFDTIERNYGAGVSVKELCARILSNSNALVNIFITNMYREKAVDKDSYLGLIEKIQFDTNSLFKSLLILI